MLTISVHCAVSNLRISINQAKQPLSDNHEYDFCLTEQVSLAIHSRL